MMKIMVLTLGLFFANTLFAGTLFITAKKHGQPAVYFEHIHVRDYGWNSAGTFVVRLENGQEILYGRRSFWDVFDYTYTPDADLLSK